MAQIKSHSCEQFQTFKILTRRNSIWYGCNKLQYQVFKYMTQRRIANTDIRVIPFDYNCWGKVIFKKLSVYIEKRNLIVKSTL